MVHGYHVIFTAYGFWLPNDPRGSWSEFVGKWELACYGKPIRFPERRHLMDLTPAEWQQRAAARTTLKYPPVQFTGAQALGIANGFAGACLRNGYVIWGCAILPEHTHLVVARHKYNIEQVSVLLKGAATRTLTKQNQHPLASYARPGKRPPRMWAEDEWHGFLDSEEAIENAIAYTNDNPQREGKPQQHWSFVTPFHGLPKGWVTYH